MSKVTALASKQDTDWFLEQAAGQAGLDDFGDLPFRDGLDALLWALRHESGIAPDRLTEAAAKLVLPGLVKRLRLVDDRKRHPQIAAQEVRAPIVITGLPRTGSTHLQALLATRPTARSPLEWEMRLPSPPPTAAMSRTDPRIAQVQTEIDARPGAARAVPRAHRLELRQPDVPGLPPHPVVL
jgi:hypothetical protein